MKTTLSIIVALAVLGGGVYLYATRSVSAPVKDVSENTSTATTTQANMTVYRISKEKSLVTFVIDEQLRGKPFTVNGTTKEVAGDISISSDTSKLPTFGDIKVNAKTFKTDSTQRDNAVARYILKTESPENELITFTTKSVDVGNDSVLQLSGDLTISGITKPAVFMVKMKKEGETLTGDANVTLKRSDFNLVIPSIPFVANVPDTFMVKATIVAEKI